MSYKDSIKETFLSMNFSGYEFSENDKEKDYVQRLDILRENYAGSLLIIDNFDRPNTDIAELQQKFAYKEIVSLDMHIIFTTRSRLDKVTPELKPLSEQNALKLFKTITKDTQAEQKPKALEIILPPNFYYQNLKAAADKLYQQIKMLLNLFDLEEYRDLLCHTTLQDLTPEFLSTVNQMKKNN